MKQRGLVALLGIAIVVATASLAPAQRKAVTSLVGYCQEITDRVGDGETGHDQHDL